MHRIPWCLATALALVLTPLVVSAAAAPGPQFVTIRQPGPQLFPKINQNGNIAYRNGTNPAAFDRLWTAYRASPNPAAPEVMLIDGQPYDPRTFTDARDFALSSDRALLFPFAALPRTTVASGAYYKAGAIRGLSGMSYTGTLGPHPFPEEGHREGAAIAADGPAFVWSEHVAGGWDVVVQIKELPLQVLRFDTGLDDRQPAANGSLMAWTSIDQFSGWHGRHTVMAKNIFDTQAPVAIASGRFPSVADPFIAYEDTSTGAPTIAYLDFGGRPQVVKTCDLASRPVITIADGEPRIVYYCPTSGTLEVSLPRFDCRMKVAQLYPFPDEEEPAQYDASGEHIIYSYYAGNGTHATDAEFDLGYALLPTQYIKNNCMP